MKNPLSYLKNRAVRLGVLATFLFTTVGLPAMGQIAGSSAFAKLDLIDWAANVILADEYSTYDYTYTAPATDTYTDAGADTYTGTADTSTYVDPNANTYDDTGAADTSTYVDPNANTYDDTGATDTGTYLDPNEGTYDDTGATDTGTYLDPNEGTYDESAHQDMSAYVNQYNPQATEWDTLYDDTTGTYEWDGMTFEQNTTDEYDNHFEGDDGKEYLFHDDTFFEWDDGEGYKQDYGFDDSDFEMHSDYWFVGSDSGQEIWDTFDVWGDNDMDTYMNEDSYMWDDWNGFNELDWVDDSDGDWWDKPVDDSAYNDFYNDFDDVLGDYDNSDNDWERHASKLDFYFDDFESKLNYRDREETRYDSLGWKHDEFDKGYEFIDAVYEDSQNLTTEMEFIKNLQDTDLNAFDNLDSSDLTQGQLAAWDLSLQKLSAYDALNAAIGVQAETLSDVADLSKIPEGTARIKSVYEQAGYDLPSDMDNDLGNLEGEVDELKTVYEDMNDDYEVLKDLANEVRATSDPDQIADLVDNMWELVDDSFYTVQDDVMTTVNSLMDEMDVLNKYESNSHRVMQLQDIGGELEGMDEMISGARTMIQEIDELNPTDPAVKAAVEALDDLTTDGLDAINTMKTAVDEGVLVENPEYIEEFWTVMDGLGESADVHMMTIMDWAIDNVTDANLLADIEMFTEDTNDGEHYDLYYDNFGFDEYSDYNDHGEYDSLEAFDAARFAMADVYDSLIYEDGFNDFVSKISEDAIEPITREVSKQVMEDIYFNLEVAPVLETALENVDIIGTESLESTTEIVNTALKIDFEAEVDDALVDETAELEDLVNEILDTLVLDKNANELEAALQESRIYVETGTEEDKAAFDLKLAEINSLLAENAKDLINDAELGFTDVATVVSEDAEWYSGYVAEALQEGVVSGHADGSFHPGDDVTYAEAMKMAMEVAGYNEGSSSTGNWYDNYLDKAKDLDLSIADVPDLNVAMPRGDVALLIGEVFEQIPADYDGAFKDVSESDENADYLQMAYDYGYMTGSNGYALADSSVNRAEVSKMFTTAGETIGAAAYAADSANNLATELEVLIEEDTTAITDTDMSGKVDSSLTGSTLNFFKNIFSSILHF